MNTTLQTVLQEVKGVCEQVSDQQLQALQDELWPGRRVFVVGEGRSGLVIRCFAMRLVHLGHTVYVIGETNTPAMNLGDLLLVASGSGNSAILLCHVQKANAKGCTCVAVTAKEDSALARACSRVLVVPGTVKGDQGAKRASVQLLSSLFDQSLHLVMDALALQIARRDGVTLNAAVQNHY